MELKQFDREHPEDRESSFEINEEEDSWSIYEFYIFDDSYHFSKIGLCCRL